MNTGLGTLGICVLAGCLAFLGYPGYATITAIIGVSIIWGNS